MAKAYGEHGTTYYVAEGDPTPDLPGVRLVGPGAPIQEAMQKRLAAARRPSQTPQPAEEAEPATSDEDEPAPSTPEAEPAAAPPAVAALKAEWVDYAVSHGADRAEAEALTKAELVERYGSA